MSIGIIPFILLIFILLLIVGVKYKRRIVLYVAAGIAVIAGVVWILGNTLFYYNDETVSVLEGEEKFSINIDNHNIDFEYYFSRFACKYSEEELYQKISEQYENTYYDKELQQIIIINDNQIYTISQYEKKNFAGRKEYRYTFMHNSVRFNIESLNSEEYVDIPFPYKALESGLGAVQENEKMTCDFEHLKTYYEDFTNVEIGENTIEIMLEKYKCTITVEGTNAHFDIH